VALKIYDKYKLIDTQIKQNLVREIKILAKLMQNGGHPHIMKMYEAIDTFSHVYLVTEYLEGMPLQEYVKT
jgi:serine/threonine protein kinase